MLEGFEGSIEEWLTSLHGINGTNGVDGVDGQDGQNGVDGTDGVDGVGIKSIVEEPTGVFTITYTNDTTFTTSNLTGAQGEQGETGATGADGVGISSSSYDSQTGILTIYYTDGSFLKTEDLRGEPGDDGTSAYEIAVENDFEGSVSEWLLSLVGEKGDQGAQGIQGEQGEVGADGSCLDCCNPTDEDSIEFVKICDDSDEFLLKLTKANNTIEYYGVYYDKDKKISYWALLSTNVEYTTTDGTSCYFKIDDDGYIEIQDGGDCYTVIDNPVCSSCRNNKVLIKHYTNSNSNQYNYICVSENAVNAHINHGDKKVECN